MDARSRRKDARVRVARVLSMGNLLGPKPTPIDLGEEVAPERTGFRVYSDQGSTLADPKPSNLNTRL